MSLKHWIFRESPDSSTVYVVVPEADVTARLLNQTVGSDIVYTANGLSCILEISSRVPDDFIDYPVYTAANVRALMAPDIPEVFE
jgi:uncharacterized cupin superfamily protein